MNNKFICAEEVAQELSVSKPYAYKLIKRLNDGLTEERKKNCRKKLMN